MITPMSKLEILVLKENLPKTISVLHNLGLLHIEPIPLTSLMEQRGIARISLTIEQEKEKSLLENLFKEINELIQTISRMGCACLPQAKKIEENFETKSVQELTDFISNKFKPQLVSVTQEITVLKDELEILPRYKEILEAFSLSKRELKIHKEMACLALIFDKHYEKDIGIFRQNLEEETKAKLEFYISPLGTKKIVALLFYPPQVVKQIDEGILKGTIKIELPARFLDKSLDEAIRSIETQLKEIPLKLEQLEKTLSEFVKENPASICAIKTITLNRLEELTITNNFLQSKYTVAITGWFPKEKLNKLNEVLEKSLGKNFVIYDRTSFIKQTQEIPVLLDNPKAIRPYELLLALLPPPKYGTMDATGMLSLFFPLFFGLIVGDIGYGVIFLGISLFLKNSAKSIIRSVGAILFAAALSSIFFGILFGEFFGNFGKEYLHLPYLLFDRHEAVIPFLILALSVGVFHIVLGFLLGIIEAFRQKHKKEVIEKISILGGIVGLFMLIATLVKILPSGFLPPSLVLLVVVIVLLVLVKGFLGPLEAISAIANILSYARLMALGLAGVMMAHIANHIGGLSENIFIGIILAALLHALNLVLSIFSPTIQSLRLHYVEFFSKFYEPGGKKYNPFKKQEVRECIP